MYISVIIGLWGKFAQKKLKNVPCSGWVDDSGLERRRADEEERLAGKFPAQVVNIGLKS